MLAWSRNLPLCIEEGTRYSQGLALSEVTCKKNINNRLLLGRGKGFVRIYYLKDFTQHRENSQLSLSRVSSLKPCALAKLTFQTLR